MIHTEVRFASATLGMRVAMNVLLPERAGPPFATLYLLHGLSDDHTIWGRLTRLEAYVGELPLAVVMPQGFRGFYTRNDAGPDYAGYVLDDVIGTAERLFPLRRDRGGRGIGGLSMGGYGALRLGLARPDLFASIHSHSGALLRGTLPSNEQDRGLATEFARIFGADPAGTDHDLVHLAERAKLSKSLVPLPAVWIDCGVDDFLIEHSRTLHAALRQLEVPHTYREFPGAHDWAYWDAHVGEAIAFHAAAMDQLIARVS